VSDAPLPDITPHLINTMIEELFPGNGSVCVEVSSAQALVRSVPTEDHIRPGGFISGPTLFAAADVALWYLTFGAIGRVEPMALTSELSIRYLRPAVGDVVWARATLEVAGRRNVVGTARIWTDDNEDRPSATAQGTYVLPH